MGENQELKKNKGSATVELDGGFYELDFLKSCLITAGIGIVLTLTGIWQLVLIAGFVGGFLPKKLKGGRGFLIGFVGIVIAWMILFGIYAITTDMIDFFQRFLVEIIGFPLGVSFFALLGCSIVGGMVGGFGGLNGVFVSRILIKRELLPKR